MEKIKEKLEGIFTNVAVLANGSASVWLSYQPKEPQNISKTCLMRGKKNAK